MKRLQFRLIVLLLMGAAAGGANATIWPVPTGQPTIQGAIDLAANTDTVLVDPGVYHEHINFMGKAILVASQFIFSGDSADIVNSIIDADSSGSAVKMISGETNASKFVGFTVRNGRGSLYQPGYGDFYVGGGFYLLGSSPTIEHNIVTLNVTEDGGAGLFSDGGNPLIRFNAFVWNQTPTYGCGAGMLIKNATGGEIDWNYVQFNTALHGGGIALKHANISITRNVISHNEALSDGGGIRIYTESTPAIINNTISDNTAPDSLGGGVEILEGSAPIFMNNIVSFTEDGGGFVVIGVCAPMLSYNLFWDNTGGDYIGIGPGTGDLTGDPAYIGGTPFDYHLTIVSAAIDRGNPDPQYRDPDGTRNDCGAFYFDMGPTTPVVLSSFSANVNAAGVELIWTTASEIICYGWIVERAQGGAFAPISDLIPGYGTTEQPHDYTFTDETAQPGKTYSYRLKQIDLGGAATYFNPITVTAGMIVSQCELAQNYPNPFNPETSLRYLLPKAAMVNLAIYDAAGRLIAPLENGYQSAGEHTVLWRADNLPSGNYLCRLEVNGQILTGRLTLVK